MSNNSSIDQYNTIAKISEGIFKDRASKFLAFAYPVISEEEVSQNLKHLKKKYYDANHHCYAFRLGAEKKIFRASDDGEPSNSAGVPILNQIKSADLTDILIVVVRYFGGTKLGVPGLINAYKCAAQEAIKNAQIVTKTVNCDYLLKFEYIAMNDIMKVIKDENLEIISQNFNLNCEICISFKISLEQTILKRFENIYEHKIIFEKIK